MIQTGCRSHQCALLLAVLALPLSAAPLGSVERNPKAAALLDLPYKLPVAAGVDAGVASAFYVYSLRRTAPKQYSVVVEEWDAPAEPVPAAEAALRENRPAGWRKRILRRIYCHGDIRFLGDVEALAEVDEGGNTRFLADLDSVPGYPGWQTDYNTWHEDDLRSLAAGYRDQPLVAAICAAAAKLPD